MTRVAVPLFGDEVAPRFCAADRCLVADVAAGTVGPLRQLTLRDASWPQRLGLLAGAGVTVLLCGGFNRRFHPLATLHGIEVIWGLFGPAEGLVRAFADGDLAGCRLAGSPRRPCAAPVRIEPGLGGQGRGRGPGRGRGRDRQARRRRGKEQ